MPETTVVSYLEGRGYRFVGTRMLQTWCPFHDERRPSFTVYPDDHWHCYSCSRGGTLDHLRWRLEAPDVPFRAFAGSSARPALPRLAERREPTTSQRKALTIAAEHYRSGLTRKARAYLAHRGVRDPERLGAGYSDGSAKRYLDLLDRLRAELNGLWLLAAQTTGLIALSGHERLRGRLFLPQQTAGGVVYYQARAVRRMRVPYLNPPNLEAPLFGDVGPRGPVVVSEGPFDVLPLIEQGIAAAALLGTSPSAVRKLDQLRGRDLIIVLDADQAGRKATALVALQCPHARFARLPEDTDDLGSWIETAGVDAVIETLLGQALTEAI